MAKSLAHRDRPRISMKSGREWWRIASSRASSFFRVTLVACAPLHILTHVQSLLAKTFARLFFERVQECALLRCERCARSMAAESSARGEQCESDGSVARPGFCGRLRAPVDDRSFRWKETGFFSVPCCSFLPGWGRKTRIFRWRYIFWQTFNLECDVCVCVFKCKDNLSQIFYVLIDHGTMYKS